MPIKHTDGADYFSQSEVEEMIKSRVKNVAERVTAAEQELAAERKRAKDLEARATTADTLAAQVEDLRQQAEQARGGLTRYQAAAGHGITDPDTIEALEGAHAKAMKGVAKDKAVDFPTYLGTAKADPSLLPSYLRGVFGQGQQPAQQPAQGQAQQPAQGQQGAANGAAQGQAQQPAQQRPAWAPANVGQQPVQTGAAPKFADRVAGAKSLDDLAALQAERASARRS